MLFGTSKRRPWTLMIYMAGDNGRVFDTAGGSVKLMAEMTSAGYRDLWEMGQVGTTPRCAVTCLFDTQGASYLVEVRKGRGMSDSVIEPLAEVNTGAPETLTDFIVRSVRKYPAERYGLIMWNHGTGWLDEDPYMRVRSGQRHRPALFRRPVPVTTRPIAFDDTSKDFLDALDLRRALSSACDQIGRRLDIIGMDACLMAGIEGARELAPFTDSYVASQEVEPMPGWPYAAVLGRINRQPRLSGEGLAIAIVEEYAASYGGRTRGDTVTQSAVSTPGAAITETLCKELVCAAMATRTPALRAKIQRARDAAMKFEDPDFRDLGDFARCLAEELRGSEFESVGKAAAALSEQLGGRGRGHPILRLGHSARYAGATGLSVFLPPSLDARRKDDIMRPYRRLIFAQDSGWDFLVEWLG